MFVIIYNNYFVQNDKYFGNNGKELSYKSITNFKDGDIISLSFNIINADKILLNGNKIIIPTVSLLSKNTSIQIKTHEFYAYHYKS